MMLRSAPRLRGGSATLLRTLLGLYVLAAALMPIGHHDIACHLKSNTHCSTCVVGSSAESAQHAALLAGCGLDDAGAACGSLVLKSDDPLARASSGRSPPLA